MKYFKITGTIIKIIIGKRRKIKMHLKKHDILKINWNISRMIVRGVEITNLII